MEKFFVHRLAQWYALHARELPWRNIRDPYRIWISEVILQQTRVAQGYDYYQRFITRFPNVEALAKASEDEVLRLWEGLGYYSRARNLHAAAQQVMERGHFPTDYAGVRALKGVGDYTAAAICSFAYGLPTAVVDGNVYRVLSRFFGIATPIDSTQGKRDFAALAQQLLPEDAAAHNQAIMDFGALQCTPKSPDCSACPLAERCAAWGEGKVESYPVKAKKVAVTTRHFVYLFLSRRHEDRPQLLIERRPKGDIWAGLYQPLLLEFDVPPTDVQLLAHPTLQALVGKDTTLLPLAKGLRHQLTHRLLLVDAYLLRLDAEQLPPHDMLTHFQAIEEREMPSFAFPRLIHLILQHSQDAEGRSPVWQ